MKQADEVGVSLPNLTTDSDHMIARMTFNRLAAAAFIAVLPAAADAQRPRYDDNPLDRPVRGAAGGSLTYGRPVGDFLKYVQQGFGFDVFFRWNVEPQGILSFKIDGGYLIYGSETVRVPLSGTIGGRILVDLTTNNNIIWMGLGPQITLPTGFIRPYANASAGFSYFFTESQVEGSHDDEPFASTTNYSDAAFRYGVGWGILIPFQTRTTEWAIDLGAIYHGNGQVEYLREGGIEDRPDGSIVVHPIRSDANLLSYRIGFSVSIR
jgi:hypothetical protein